jgi:hypothetical protein
MITEHLEKLLNAHERAQVRAILLSHRRNTIAALPPGPASVVARIIRDAKSRDEFHRHVPDKGQLVQNNIDKITKKTGG